MKDLILRPDDRGMLVEVLKITDPIVDAHPFAQISHTITYPGVIKAFHWHRRQTDYWYCVAGNIRVALVDLRQDSPTGGEQMTVYLGEWSRKVCKIPPGVAHGYQVLGNAPAQLLYYVTEAYDPQDPDEERIPWDDPAIGYDWTIRNR
jgi:dTDP-4-dehydrorhamnose 3,5-epimerase